MSHVAFAQLRRSAHDCRRHKTNLLPLPRRITDVLSLEYHALLEALRMGWGSLYALKHLTRVALATTFLARSGYGDLDGMIFSELLDDLSKVYVRAEETGVYVFDTPLFERFAKLVTVHDRQLQAAPVRLIEVIAQKVECYGERCT
jgi:hypothetical protein